MIDKSKLLVNRVHYILNKIKFKSAQEICSANMIIMDKDSDLDRVIYPGSTYVNGYNSILMNDNEDVSLLEGNLYCNNEDDMFGQFIQCNGISTDLRIVNSVNDIHYKNYVQIIPLIDYDDNIDEMYFQYSVGIDNEELIPYAILCSYFRTHPVDNIRAFKLHFYDIDLIGDIW